MVVIILLTGTAAVNAESVYITDELSVGLHEDKTLDSPILVILKSGTELELVKREENLSFVQDAKSGISGWIDNSYIESGVPASSQVSNLEARNNALERQLNDLKRSGGGSSVNTGTYEKLVNENAALQQQLNSEKLSVGELQVTIAELRKRMGQDNNTETLFKENETLREINKGLEIQLAGALEGNPGAVVISDDNPVSLSDGKISFSLRNLAITALVLIVIGLSAGIYLMDFLNRRRHGGFRV